MVKFLIKLWCLDFMFVCDPFIGYVIAFYFVLFTLALHSRPTISLQGPGSKSYSRLPLPS